MSAHSYKRYLLIILLVVLAFNYVDRLALALVLQDIKIDLRLTDTQLGVLNGIAFALFYALMGVPMGRWADRGNRVTIISITAAIWSIMVALCGTARSFTQLLVMRTGVAVGESGCMPSALSLIADQFGRAERPRAVAIFMLGTPFGVLMGFSLAGFLNDLYGWRTMFVVLGLPGLILALLVNSTLHEPRQKSKGRATRDGNLQPEQLVDLGQPSLREVCSTLWNCVTYRHLFLFFVIAAFFNGGIMQWLPTYLIRSYGVKTGELGVWLSLIYGVGGMVGTYLGGVLATRYAANNEGLQLKGSALIYSGFGLLSLLIFLTANRYVALSLMAVSSIGVFLANGPLFAALQTLVPQRMRATSVAVLYLFTNLVSLGLGPLAVGVLSDALRPLVGEGSLRWALLILCPGFVVGSWYLLLSSRTIAKDLVALSRHEQQFGELPNRGI